MPDDWMNDEIITKNRCSFLPPPAGCVGSFRRFVFCSNNIRCRSMKSDQEGAVHSHDVAASSMPSPYRKIRSQSRRFAILQWLVRMLSVLLGAVTFQLLQVHFELLSSLENGCTQKRGAPVTSSTRQAVSSQSQYQQEQEPKSKSKSKFAYAFLISGCDPASPLSYRPYLWNVLVATKNLVDSGSQADVVLMIQMVSSSGDNTTSPSVLPPNDLQWLELYSETIRIRYLPSLLRQNFYSAQMAKFHVLQLTEYERVMYLDADVMPLCSLDYIMELSWNGQLQPNVIMAYFNEPAHGGLFVLKPSPSLYDEWEAVVERREQEALQLPYPHWDPVRGWGQALTEEWVGLPQAVEPIEDNGGLRQFIGPLHSTNWTFHGDFADQGLLYYWTRFHQKAVSILYLDSVLDFVGDETAVNRSSHEIFFHSSTSTTTSTTQKSCTCLPPGEEYLGHYGSTLYPPLFYEKIPHRDFIHFSGQRKPWEEPRHDFPTPPLSSSVEYWYFQLQAVFQEFAKRHPERKLPKLPLKYRAPSLGRYPTYRSMIGTIQKKLRKQQQQQLLLME